MRCNRCHRPMAGTTAYDGACECGGLIEAAPMRPDPVGQPRRHSAACDDCGWERPVRWVAFWVNGYRMQLCEACERPYRSRLVRYKSASGRMTHGAPTHA